MHGFDVATPPPRPLWPPCAPETPAVARPSLVGFAGLLDLCGPSPWAAEEDDIEEDDEGEAEEGGGGEARALHLVPPPRSPRVEVVGTAHRSPAVLGLARTVVRGLKAQALPARVGGSMGGCYLFKDESGAPAAIVKPCDEEPMAPNNPHGYVGRALGEPGLKAGVRVGEAAMREVAAYLLDAGGAARVPATALARVTHPVFHVADASGGGGGDGGGSSSAGLLAASLAGAPAPAPRRRAHHPPAKLASLQAYVPHACDASDVSASRFCVADVHRLGILDLRTHNTDRHAGNILVLGPDGGSGTDSVHAVPSSPGAVRAVVAARAPLRLVPIDHGFCLPDTLEPLFLEWLHWPQVGGEGGGRRWRRGATRALTPHPPLHAGLCPLCPRRARLHRRPRPRGRRRPAAR